MFTAVVAIAFAANQMAADCREGSCYWQENATWPVDTPDTALCSGANGTVTMGHIVDDGSLFAELALEYVAARQNQTCAAWDGYTQPIQSGLTSFFDPNNAAKIVLDSSGKVQSLGNLAATTGMDLTQTTSTKRPAVVVDNGRKVLVFNGTTNLQSTADVQLYTPGANWTIVAEVKPTAVPSRLTSQNAPWAMNGIAGALSTLNVGVAFSATGTNVDTTAWHVGAKNGWDPSQITMSSSATVNQWSVVVGEFGHVSPAVTVDVDARAPLSGVHVSDHNASGPFSVGRAYTPGNAALVGRVGRVLTYNRALTNDELAQTRQFFAGTGVAPAMQRAQVILADCAVDSTEMADAQQILATLLGYNDGGDTQGQCVQPVCGDGAVNQASEECDDGNTTSGDGCSSTCKREKCGDGVVNNAGTEECDDGNNVDGDGCSSTCHIEYCGDGTVNDRGTEECDDGNNTDGDGCSSTCKREYCGDGVYQPGLGEFCDDGNNIDGDGCSSSCRIEYCGDGSVNNAGQEQCDDGNNVNGDGCSSTCKVEKCGDGVVNNNGTEDCDDGNNVDGDGCSSTCKVEKCGDGVVNNNGTEQCDDGNTASGDGCSSTCVIEKCGDGLVNNAGTEQCDDGNTGGGDGCGATCLVEAGYVCTGTPSHCVTTCGDGVRAGAEQCDDGNLVSGDGCTAACTLEFCGDGVVNDANAEECDDGNNTSGDGCNTSCAWDRAYWTEGQTVRRATLNGSEEDIATTNLSAVEGIALTHDAVFWSDYNARKIERAAFDGSGRQTIFNAPSGTGTHDIAIDEADGKLYFAHHSSSGAIRRMNLDGTQVETLVSGLGIAQGVGLDLVNRKIYWTDTNTHKVSRANLDGSSVDDVITNLNFPWDVAIDPAQDALYVSDENLHVIVRAHLDGSAVQTIWSSNDSPKGLVLDSPNRRLYVLVERETLVSGIFHFFSELQRINLDSLTTEALWTRDDGQIDGYLALDFSSP